LERVYDFGAEAFDAIFDTLRMTTPCIVLDVPTNGRRGPSACWSAPTISWWSPSPTCQSAQRKNLVKELKTSRPNDRTPLYCINQVGMPKRPEINVREFAKAMESQPIAAIPFDSRTFGTAANNGQMIAETSGCTAPPRSSSTWRRS